MSWEEIKRSQRKCPCGKEVYVIISIMDDWNRSEEHWKMECSKCENKYSLYSYYYPNSGMMEERHFWMPKKLLEAVQRMESDLKNDKAELLKLARSKYLEGWLSTLGTVKSKKEIWRQLTDNGKRYPSYSAMLSHLRNTDLRTYLDQHFSYENLIAIFKVLGIVDHEIQKRLIDIDAFQGKLIRSKEDLLKEGFE